MPKEMNKAAALKAARQAVRDRSYPEMSALLNMPCSYRDELVTAVADETLRQGDLSIFSWLVSWEWISRQGPHEPILKALDPVRVQELTVAALEVNRPEALLPLVEALKKDPAALNTLLPPSLCGLMSRRMVKSGKASKLWQFLVHFTGSREGKEPDDPRRVYAILPLSRMPQLVDKLKKGERYHYDLLNLVLRISQYDDLFQALFPPETIRDFVAHFRGKLADDFIGLSMLIELGLSRPDVAALAHTPEVLGDFSRAIEASPNEFTLLNMAVQFGASHPKLPYLLPTDHAARLQDKLLKDPYHSDVVIWLDRLCRKDPRLAHLALTDQQFVGLVQKCFKGKIKQWRNLAVLYQDAAETGRRNIVMDMKFAAAEVVSAPQYRNSTGHLVLAEGNNIGNNAVVFVGNDGKITVGSGSYSLTGKLDVVVRMIAKDETNFVPAEKQRILTDLFAACRRMKHELTGRITAEKDFGMNFNTAVERGVRAVRNHLKDKTAANVILGKAEPT